MSALRKELIALARKIGARPLTVKLALLVLVAGIGSLAVSPEMRETRPASAKPLSKLELLSVGWGPQVKDEFCAVDRTLQVSK